MTIIETARAIARMMSRVIMETVRVELVSGKIHYGINVL